MDTHHDPETRGVYMTACEHCGGRRACRLVMSGDRYLWTCLGRCIERWRGEAKD